MKKITLLLLAALAASGCSDHGSRDDTSLLLNRYYVLTAVDGQTVAPRAGIRPGISFMPENRVSGVMCNRFFGKAQWHQGQLQVLQLASTRMLCRDGELNQWEQTLGQMLASGAEVRQEGQTLTLKGAGHTLSYQLVPPQDGG